MPPARVRRYARGDNVKKRGIVWWAVAGGEAVRLPDRRGAKYADSHGWRQPAKADYHGACLCSYFHKMTTNFLRSGSMAHLLVLALGIGCMPSLCAQTLPFAGRWQLDAPPGAPAAYTRLTIKATTLSWAGPTKSAPTCVQQFTVKQEKPGTEYLDGHGTKFIAGVRGSLPTFLVQVSASTCGNVGEDVRISFPLVYDLNHIEVIEYAKSKPVSSRRFKIKK